MAKEDKASLDESGMPFNLHAIVGGQLEKDTEPKLYLLYPEGNWIEIGESIPFVIIDNTGFGLPILRRSITYNEMLEYALRSGFHSFDATRLSANDVGYPQDTFIMKKDSFKIQEHRFRKKELHAWVEVLLSGAGWVGLDPGSGLFPNEYYIPAATSHDPSNTMPVTGLYRGTGSSKLDTSVSINVLEK